MPDKCVVTSFQTRLEILSDKDKAYFQEQVDAITLPETPVSSKVLSVKQRKVIAAFIEELNAALKQGFERGAYLKAEYYEVAGKPVIYLCDAPIIYYQIDVIPLLEAGEWELGFRTLPMLAALKEQISKQSELY